MSYKFEYHVTFYFTYVWKSRNLLFLILENFKMYFAKFSVICRQSMCILHSGQRQTASDFASCVNFRILWKCTFFYLGVAADEVN